MARIGIGILGDITPPESVECVQLAERLGYESAWMAEGRAGDQFSILTSADLKTERIKLGTSISSVFVRSAPTIAMAAATVDYFSNGRLLLGLGSDHRVQVGPMHGLEYGKPMQRLREAIDIIRILLGNGVVSYQGEVFNIEQYDLWFQPLRPEIPIYVAGVRSKMLQVCGEIGQGAIMTWCALNRVAPAREDVRLGAQRAGRLLGDVDIATMIPTMVSTDRKVARSRMRARVAYYACVIPRYGRLMVDAGFGEEVAAINKAWYDGDHDRAASLVSDGLMDEFTLAGNPDECRARIEQFRQAGIDLPLLSLRFTGKDSKDQILEAIRGCAP